MHTQARTHKHTHTYISCMYRIILCMCVCIYVSMSTSLDSQCRFVYVSVIQRYGEKIKCQFWNEVKISTGVDILDYISCFQLGPIWPLRIKILGIHTKNRHNKIVNWGPLKIYCFWCMHGYILCMHGYILSIYGYIFSRCSWVSLTVYILQHTQVNMWKAK